MPFREELPFLAPLVSGPLLQHTQHDIHSTHMSIVHIESGLVQVRS